MSSNRRKSIQWTALVLEAVGKAKKYQHNWTNKAIQR